MTEGPQQILTNPLLQCGVAITESSLEKAVERVTQEQLNDFATRFTVCPTDKDSVTGTVRLYEHRLEKYGALNYFGKRAGGEKVELGRVADRHLVGIDKDVILGTEVGTIHTYHYFNADSIFAGVIGELVAQLPPSIVNDTGSHYYVLYCRQQIAFSRCGGMHVIDVTFFRNQ
jgi:hypothetical protein